MQFDAAKIVGILGCLILGGGLFAPILSVGPDSFPLFDTPDGIVFVGVAAVCLVLVLIGWEKLAALVGLVGAVVLFIDYDKGKSTAAALGAQLEWGWIVMALGLALVIISGGMSFRRRKPAPAA